MTTPARPEAESPSGVLAILVVFMVEPAFEGLIPLFLDRVRRHTRGAYRIYASVNHLSERQRGLVEGAADVLAMRCDIGAVERGRLEHAVLLEALRRAARADGAECFVTLHLDSFPIVDAWDDRLRAELTAGARFVTIVPQGYSACLFWDRAFDASEDLALLVPEAERATPEFQRFRDVFPDYDHVETGLNFIYRAYRRDWRWARLQPTAYQVYGDAVFHLVGGARLTVTGEGRMRTPWAIRRLGGLVRPVIARMPRGLQNRLRDALLQDAETGRDGSRAAKRAELQALLQDPAAYLETCRRDRFADSRPAA